MFHGTSDYTVNVGNTVKVKQMYEHFGSSVATKNYGHVSLIQSIWRNYFDKTPDNFYIDETLDPFWSKACRSLVALWMTI
jgi:hypothetical protein